MKQSAPRDESLSARLGMNTEALAELCRRWRITEFSLFGSILRSDFRPDSDVDVLVTFAPDAAHSVFDLAELQEDLERLVGRPVDLVEARSLRNPFRRREILDTRRVVYASAA